MPDAVLFDLDETLLDRTASLRAFLRDQFHRFGPELGAVSLEAWETRFLERDARGSVHKSKVYPALLRDFGGNPGAADRLLADYAVNCWRHARSFGGMAELLGALRAQGKKLAVVTNGETAFQRRHIEALALDRLVDEVLISEEEGLRKPAPELFHRAAARLGGAIVTMPLRGRQSLRRRAGRVGERNEDALVSVRAGLAARAARQPRPVDHQALRRARIRLSKALIANTRSTGRSR